MYGPTPWDAMPLNGTTFDIGLYSKKLETSFFHESLVWMH